MPRLVTFIVCACSHGKTFLNLCIDIKFIIQLCAKRTFCHRYLSCKVAKTTIQSIQSHRTLCITWAVIRRT
jgi:hypothetical protein